MNTLFFLVPVLTALTGLIVIRIPFLLIFHPVNAFSFAGIRIQGILPMIRQKLAGRIGTYVSSQFSLDGLEDTINDPANFEKIKPSIETHIDEFLRVKLKAQMPMIAMFIGEKTIVTMKTVFMEEIGNMFPQIIGQFAGNLKERIRIDELVTTRLQALDLAALEQSARPTLRKALGSASLAGFTIGLLVGLVQLLILWQAAR